MKEKLQSIFRQKAGMPPERLPRPLRFADRVGGVLTGRKHVWLGNLLAFLLPMLILGLFWAIKGVAPFGNRMILAHDQWHQYYPFFVDLRERLQSGGSLLYSWTTGMGTNYLPMLGYYLASPLNLPLLFLPAGAMLGYYTLTVLLKIGLAGLFFRIFLCKLFRRSEGIQVLFAAMYALCAYIMGYYWNAIWLDTVALLPLVALGAILLLREKRFVLYVAALALSVLCSFYIGYMVILFVLLVFVFYNVANWDDLGGFFFRLGRLLLWTLIALGITAVLTIPTFLALQNNSSAGGGVSEFLKRVLLPALTFWLPESIRAPLVGTLAQAGSGYNWEWTHLVTTQKGFAGFLDGLRLTFGNAALFAKPTSFNETLPNVFCGVSSLLMAMLYCCCRRITVRERVCSFLMLLLLAASFIIKPIDTVWHGFHIPNMLPFRYSFLFSFTVLFMGYRAYTQLDRFRWYHLLIVLPVVGLFVYCVASSQEITALIGTAVVLAVCMAGLALYGFGKLTRNLVTLLLAVCLLFEAFVSAGLGMQAVGTTAGKDYPWRAEDSRAVIGEMYAREEGNPDPWRAEFALKNTLNESTFFSIPGVSVFSSACNSNVTRFMAKIGCEAGVTANRYIYQQSDPAINLLLGVKYLICREGVNEDPTHFTEIANSNGVLLLENKDYLPMGWAVEQQVHSYDLAEASGDGADAANKPDDADGRIFERINALYGSMVDRRLQLYDTLLAAKDDYEGGAERAGSNGMRCFFRAGEGDDPQMSISFTASRDGGMSIYSHSSNTGNAYLYVNDSYHCYYEDKYGTVRYVDGLKAGDVVTLRYRIGSDKSKAGSSLVYAAMFREDEFRTLRQELSGRTMTVRERTDTALEADVMAQKDAVLVTTIPYDAGWTATVDGAEARIVALDGAFLTVPLEMGGHTVSLRYEPPGYTAGKLITGISLALFLIGVVLRLILKLVRSKAPKVRMVFPADETAAGQGDAPFPAAEETLFPAEEEAPQNDASPEDVTTVSRAPTPLTPTGTGKMPKLVPEEEFPEAEDAGPADFPEELADPDAPAEDDDFEIPPEWLE